MKDLSKKASWQGIHAASSDRVKDVPLPKAIPGAPTGATAIMYQIRDGERMPGEESNRERCETSQAKDGTDAIFPDKEYEAEFTVYFDKDWPNSTSDWNIFRQLHLLGGRQPIIIFATANNQIKFKTSRAYGHTTHWTTALTREKWYKFKVRFCPSKGTTKGYVQLWMDDQLVLPKKAVSILPDDTQLSTSSDGWKSPSGNVSGICAYWKQGGYRTAAINGATNIYFYRARHGVAGELSEPQPQPQPEPIPEPIPEPTPTPTPDPALVAKIAYLEEQLALEKALIVDLATDFNAIVGRLSTVNTWVNLTGSQRESITQAKGRAEIGLRRIADRQEN